jgi:hypothetical protein
MSVRLGVWLVALALSLSPAVLRADQLVIYVPGTSDPWLAGAPDGTKASAHPSDPSNSPDVAPTHSPVLVNGAAITPGAVLTFGVTGSAGYGPDAAKASGPDGKLYDGKFIHHLIGAQNGISDVVAPINALLGVFLDGNVPTTAPTGLDFRSGGLGVTSPGTLGAVNPVAGGTGYATLAPGLGQVFFIGDGLGAGGVAQQVTVPNGATRLFLGTADGWKWADNSGGYVVTLNSESVGQPASAPEPAALTLAGLGGIGGLWLARRRRRESAGSHHE